MGRMDEGFYTLNARVGSLSACPGVLKLSNNTRQYCQSALPVEDGVLLL